MKKPSLTEYRKSLDNALIEYMDGNEGPIDAHLENYGMTSQLKHPLVKKVGLMKAVTGNTALPMSVRTKAKLWLELRGLAPHDDGDVPI